MTELRNEILLAILHDLWVIYFIGLLLGMVVGFIRWATIEKLTFFKALAPAVVWPFALLKESWKYLKS